MLQNSRLVLLSVIIYISGKPDLKKNWVYCGSPREIT